MSDANLLSYAWPASRVGEALEQLAHRSGLSRATAEATASPEALNAVMSSNTAHGRDVIERWIEAVAGRLKLEVEAVEAPYPEAETLLSNAAPALLGLPVATSGVEEPYYLALLEGGRRSIKIVNVDGAVRRVRKDEILAAIRAPLELPILESVNHLLAKAGISQDRMPMVRAAILREQLNQARIGNCWLLRLAPDASMWQQARRAGLPRYLATFVMVHLAQLLLFIASWWFIGRAVLSGSFEKGWLTGWALLLLTLVPLGLFGRWSQNMLAIGAGGLFKRRLLYGALRLQPDEIKHQGAGQFLGRVMESEALELLALGGGFAALVALIELFIAMWVLSQGAGGITHSLMLLAWVGLALLLGWLDYRRSQDWVNAHLAMTDDLVERMVGHRTRLAQESPLTWHDLEDQQLAHYVQQTMHRDRISVLVSALIPRGWLVLGLGGIVFAYLTGSGSPAALAISLGGILLASRALDSLVLGYSSIISAALAWKQTSSIYRAADRPSDEGELSAVFQREDADGAAQQTRPLLTARDLAFRYRDRGLPVLQGVNLDIFRGDRLLLEGPSGGGKSTLASLLIGLRRPESGLLLLHGLDRYSLGGHVWRRHVVSAPQFQENYVLTGTVAYNLLMGRRWPATPEDLREAEQVCRELGLDEVLNRMPAGLQQMVGEGGWQLSNGEQSRLYIARALLQKADLIVFDESFASLDPTNLRRALACVLRRAPTLMVIAHP
jgi:ATP-binding cassette subfamily B protein